ncbi:MAG: ribonuclease D [Candidatus Tectimicrobiota bacterium]|nr:MAG: ribonuclease D [Candidatus Tectomicrobia bacterium]
MRETEAAALHTTPVLYLSTLSALERFCAQARAEGRVALDVEFVREVSYAPKLALVQLATTTACAIVDPLAVADLSPLGALLAAPEVEKVLHAAHQDLEVLYWHTQALPVHLFDTQIAAAFAGLGEQQSYPRLVERLLGVALPKNERNSDWLQRPLTPQQVAYALDDVRYLLPLHDHLCLRLHELGRLAWVREECARFEEPERYRRDAQRLLHRIRRRHSLSAQGMAVLLELVLWRDEEARRRDRPPGSVLRDEALVEIARKAPRSAAELRSLRRLPQREVERSEAALLAAVARGLARGSVEVPAAAPRLRLSETEELAVKFLEVCLRLLCKREKLPPSLVATRAELESLVRQYRRGQRAAHPLLSGWRRELVGEELLAVLRGQRSVQLDPDSARVCLTPHHA